MIIALVAGRISADSADGTVECSMSASVNQESIDTLGVIMASGIRRNSQAQSSTTNACTGVAGRRSVETERRWRPPSDADRSVSNGEFAMGLDSLELVMEIEDAFSIEIPDDEASRMLTVGDIHEYIVANTSLASNRSVCLSAIAFRSLRRAATSIGLNDRLRPRDPTFRLLPDTNVRGFWANLADSAKLKLPRLRRPQWIVTLATFAVLIVAAWVGVVAYRSTQSQIAAIAASVAVAVLSGWAMSALTDSFAVLPARNFTTLRGLAECILALNFKTIAERCDGAHSNDVWIALRAIIVEQLGVSPDVVTPTASFVKDLGCG